MSLQETNQSTFFQAEPVQEAFSASLASTPRTQQLPMAETFFTGAIIGKRLAHAYILKGKAYGGMYNLALTVARIVNCKNRPDISLPTGTPVALDDLTCGQCIDCRWIAQNAHPAVLTVSRMTYVSAETGSNQPPRLMTTEELEKLAKSGKWPTLLKADQMSLLIQQVLMKSEHTRVIIFTDSEELPAGTPSDIVAPSEWASLEASEGKSLHIRPLERKLFNESSANRFLKTLEEPPPHTLFFFITETEEQLLPTIVSRCQVVPCATSTATADSTAALLTPEVTGFLAGFTRRLADSQDIYAIAGEFEQALVVDGGLSHTQALEAWQGYLRQIFSPNFTDEAAFTAYRKLQQAIDQGLRMLAARTNESQSLLSLFLEAAVPAQQLSWR